MMEDFNDLTDDELRDLMSQWCKINRNSERMIRELRSEMLHRKSCHESLFWEPQSERLRKFWSPWGRVTED